ncbi:hypothetical protein BDR26DRAFT_1011861 [Obelidium mucronatum]|nr:hypothetical protein BDR26DRAFT_1011861 [Obelidium mucronatum]
MLKNRSTLPKRVLATKQGKKKASSKAARRSAAKSGLNQTNATSSSFENAENCGYGHGRESSSSAVNRGSTLANRTLQDNQERILPGNQESQPLPGDLVQGPNRLQTPQSGDQLWNGLNKLQVDNLRLIFQKRALSDEFFVPPFNVDDTATVTWLWETLASVLGWTPARTRILVTNLPLEMPKMYQTTVQLYRSNLMSAFKDKFLYLEVGDSQRQGPQLFMNESFLAASVLFFKVSHATRTMSVAGFLQTKSMHVLACIACCVRHAIDLVAVKRRDFKYATKSGKTYRQLLNAFSYNRDDDDMKEEREVVLEGRNRFYAAMARRLLPDNENETGGIRIRR